MDDAGWEWVYAEVDEHEWADGVRLDGVKVDVSQFTTATIDGYLDALRTGDTEPGSRSGRPRCRTAGPGGRGARRGVAAPAGDLEARIRAVLAAPMAGVPDFVRLTHETPDLVDAHVPAYDVAAARADFGTSLRG